MGTRPETEALLRDCLGDRIATRPMFGEYAVYLGGKTVALLCDDTLFVRQLPEATRYLEDSGHAPVTGKPYPRAKDHWQIDPDLWEDTEWLLGLLSVIEAALPAPKPKREPKPKA
ncbi:TfoX/Sxy family protein [Thioclava sp.]|uniref:TfoX/Sxy family protein n=1 Tax=Thioclava sp. TaxID=1933450 RepID=UPI0032425CBB